MHPGTTPSLLLGKPMRACFCSTSDEAPRAEDERACLISVLVSAGVLRTSRSMQGPKRLRSAASDRGATCAPPSIAPPPLRIPGIRFSQVQIPKSLVNGTGPFRPAHTTGPSVNEDTTGYLPVALPVGPLTGEEWVVRCWLNVAVDVERPRPNPVLARAGRPPVEPPEFPAVPRDPLLLCDAVLSMFAGGDRSSNWLSTGAIGAG
jgi:hypothetical protein